MKRKVKIIILLIISVNVLSIIISSSFSHSNYLYNKELNEEEYIEEINGYVPLINNQGNTSSIKYGFFRSDYNGCGWISVYNLLHLDNKDVAFEEIIKNLDIYGTNLFGLLGTNPFAIMAYLRSFGYKPRIIFDTSKFDEIASQGRLGIVGALSLNGGHYQAFIYNQDNKYEFFNYHLVLDSLVDYVELANRTINFIIVI